MAYLIVRAFSDRSSNQKMSFQTLLWVYCLHTEKVHYPYCTARLEMTTARIFLHTGIFSEVTRTKSGDKWRGGNYSESTVE